MQRRDGTRRAFLAGLAALGTALSCRAFAPSAPAGDGRRILVLGGTGRLGRLVVARLVGSGHTVRVLVRPERTTAAPLPPAVELVRGDLRDRENLRAALAGMDRVIFTASASGGGTSDNTPEAVDYGGVVNLVAVAPRGLRQVVLVSSAAVTQPLHPHNMWRDILRWKLKGEDHLRASGLPYTVLRPTGMRDYPGGVEGIGLAQGDTFAFGYVIAREDAASVCAATVDSEAALRKTFEAYNEATIAPGPVAPKFAALRDDTA